MTPREETEALLKARDFPLEYLAGDFIEWHLKDGKSPQQIVAIATKPGGECWCRICGVSGGHADGCRNDRPWAI